MWEIKRTASDSKYELALVPNHPNANNRGYVLLHRIIMENHIGRILKRNEVVHHINENPRDNCIDNLRLMSLSEHSRMHTKKYKQNTNFVLLRCPECDKVFIRTARKSFVGRNDKIATMCSRKCGASFGHKHRKMSSEELILHIRGNLIAEFSTHHDNAENEAAMILKDLGV